jgi:hypothetical protein
MLSSWRPAAEPAKGCFADAYLRTSRKRLPALRDCGTRFWESVLAVWVLIAVMGVTVMLISTRTDLTD